MTVCSSIHLRYFDFMLCFILNNETLYLDLFLFKMCVILFVVCSHIVLFHFALVFHNFAYSFQLTFSFVRLFV